MGGFTKVVLKDGEQLNIDSHNAKLELYGVTNKYHFYSSRDVVFEYEAYKLGLGVFREVLFPRDKIYSLYSFEKYWNSEALGEAFVPKYGTLTFDCYFGRTSERAMRNIAKYVIDNLDSIYLVGGSFESFIEKAMSKKQEKIFRESDVIID